MANSEKLKNRVNIANRCPVYGCRAKCDTNCMASFLAHCHSRKDVVLMQVSDDCHKKILL